MRCFFDNVHGVGPCLGEVRIAGGEDDVVRSFPGVAFSSRGYCQAHRAGLIRRAMERIKVSTQASVAADVDRKAA